MKLSNCTLLIFLFFFTGLSAQQQLDSMRNVISIETNDSLRIRAISELGYAFEKMGEQDSSVYYYHRAIHHSKNLDQPFQMAQNYRYLGLFYYSLSQLDSALKYYRKAEDIFNDIWEGGELGKLLIDIGNLHYTRWSYIAGIEYFQRAAEYYEKREHLRGQSIAYGNLGALYYELNQWEKSEFYHQKCYETAVEEGNQKGIAVALHNIGGVLEEKDSLDKALEYYLHSLDVMEDETDFYLSHIHNSIASVAGKKREYAKAINYGNLAVEYANTPALKASFRIHLGRYYMESGFQKEAEKVLKEGIAVCEALKLQGDLKEGLSYIYQLKADQGDYKQAYDYAFQHNIVSDSIFDSEVNERIHRLETQFRTEIREKENMALKAENAENALALKSTQARLRFRTSIALLALILLGAGSIIFYVSRKNAIQEKQLVTTKAMIAGEETERNRLARELHDGLGGLLSTANLQLGQLARTHGFLKDDIDYDRTSYLIKKASTELRHVAHNLMPGALLKMGLIPAVQDLCSDISFAQSLEVDFQHYGIDDRLPKKYETGIYRIIQELLTNIIKHARAKQAWIQIMRRENQISVTIEDDGVGFEPDPLDTQKGMGLKTIRTRVNYLKGTIDWISSPTEGTSVHIQLLL